MYSNYDDHKKAVDLLKAAKEYVVAVHDRAEIKHDMYGEFYMDQNQFEIMETTEKLISEIDKIVENFYKYNEDNSHYYANS